MALLPLPKHLHPEFKKKNRQPLCPVEIDWSNPLTRGLVGVYLFNQSGQNLVTKESFDVNSGDFSLVKNRMGSAWEAGTSGDLWDQGHLVDFNNDGATVVMHSNNLASGSSFARPVNYSSTASPSDLGWLLIFESSGSNMYWTSRDAGTWYFGTARADFGAATGEQVFTTRVDNISKDIFYNLNGTKTSDIGLTGQNLINITAADKFHLGDVNDTINGQINTVFLYNRALTEAEDEALHADLYQILKPATPQFYFVPDGAGGAFTLTADSGSYAYTGTANSLLLDALLGADTGAYSYTGTAADLTSGYGLQADSGSYAYTGTANSLLTDRLLVADTGSYAYSGTANALTRDGTLTADPGAYSYSGTDVNLTFESPGDFTLAANTGVYSVSGTDADLKAALIVAADSGSYNYAGTDAGLVFGYSLTADTGSYSYTGTDVTFSTTIRLNAESGNYVYNGNNATLSASGQVWTVQTDSVTTWTTQTDSNTIWNIEG